MTHPPPGDLALEPGQPQLGRASGDGDFIDAAPAADEPAWPPPGAFPGEPGHADDDARPTVAIPVYSADQTQAGQTQAGQTQAGQTQLVATGWHQPAPTEPWHAQHERAGEWQTQPPEHLSFEHSPPAELQPGVQGHAAGHPIHIGHQPYEAPLLPMEHEPARQRRSGLWVSLALVVTLLLCGGGATSAYLLLRDADTGTGAPDPATAVNRFLSAVYTQQDAEAASALVCRESRNEGKLGSRVQQIKTYATEYDSPSFRWSEPAVATQGAKKATVAVQLTMTTDDEKQAQQELTFTVVQKTGWRVCDITG
jgi:hypothetical protein